MKIKRIILLFTILLLAGCKSFIANSPKDKEEIKEYVLTIYEKLDTEVEVKLIGKHPIKKCAEYIDNTCIWKTKVKNGYIYDLEIKDINGNTYNCTYQDGYKSKDNSNEEEQILTCDYLNSSIKTLLEKEEIEKFIKQYTNNYYIINNGTDFKIFTDINSFNSIDKKDYDYITKMSNYKWYITTEKIYNRLYQSMVSHNILDYNYLSSNELLNYLLNNSIIKIDTYDYTYKELNISNDNLIYVYDKPYLTTYN